MVMHLLHTEKIGGSIPSITTKFFALLSLMVEVLFCKQGVRVRFLQGAPSFTPIGEMVSLMVWDHGAQVRFLHRRPVFWAVSANGNTSGLQPEIESSILSISTNFYAGLV